MPGRPHSSGRRSGPPSGGPHSGGGGGGGWSPGAGRSKTGYLTTHPSSGGGGGGTTSTPPPKTGGASPFTYTKTPKGRRTIGITDTNKFKKWIAKNKYEKWDELISQGIRGFTQQPRYIPWGLNKYIEGSTPGMAKIWAGTEKVPSAYSQYRTKGLGNLDDLLKSFTGKIPLGKYNLPTGSEGVHVATKPSVAAGYASKWTDPFRGTKWATKTGEVLSGEIPTKFLNQSRNMWGQIQSIIPADVANKALLGKNVNLSNVKNIAKPVSKFMTRAVPVAGGVVSAADAAYRASKGDVLGATLSGASSVPGWGLIPLAGQVVTDWMGITGPKTYKAKGGIVNLYKYGGFI